MYDNIIEHSTSDIIKQNLDGIKKISKERILIELIKILGLKNFLKISNNEVLTVDLYPFVLAIKIETIIKNMPVKIPGI